MLAVIDGGIKYCNAYTTTAGPASLLNITTARNAELNSGAISNPGYYYDCCLINNFAVIIMLNYDYYLRHTPYFPEEAIT